MVMLLLLSGGVFRLTLAERRTGFRRIDTFREILSLSRKTRRHLVVTDEQPFPAFTLHIRGGGS
jgi:hypothetical protein